MYDRKDAYYRKAREEGYRSRAAFKLIELDKRFHLLRRRFRVLDLGAWPGGWLQVAAAKVGPGGLAVGIDLVDIETLPDANVRTFMGDVSDPEVMGVAREAAGGGFDLVLSDMSPKLSGIKELDAAATVHCAEVAREVAKAMLRPGGNLVIKLFKSGESDRFVKDSRSLFGKVQRVELDSTRKSSNEFYFVGLGLKPQAATAPHEGGSEAREVPSEETVLEDALEERVNGDR